MQTKDKDINIIFYPNKGLGKILFDDNKNNIINKLGLPEKEEYDKFDEEDYTVRLFYFNYDISFNLHYENENYDYMSIHLEDIILGNTQLSLLSKKEIKDYIKSYYINNNLIWNEEVVDSIDSFEECFDYPFLGLTLWFEKDEISDICIKKGSL